MDTFEGTRTIQTVTKGQPVCASTDNSTKILLKNKVCLSLSLIYNGKKPNKQIWGTTTGLLTLAGIEQFSSDRVASDTTGSKHTP